MKWLIKEKDMIMKTRFALFPKRIGSYRIWFEKYYVNYDWVFTGQGGDYIAHYFLNKEDCEQHIYSKELDRFMQDKHLIEY